MAARHSITLALQGGGSHGAFTWGAVDHLLQAESVEVTAITGTSSGAFIAVLAAYGLNTGGPERASELLQAFWKQVSVWGSFSPLQPTPLDKWLSPGNMDFSPFYWMAQFTQQLFSPYQLNPFNVQPLRQILEELIDFAQMDCCQQPRVYLSATNVRTGLPRRFPPEAITPEVVMASACLPNLYHAVDIDGEAYWDGGFMGNPLIYPLLEDPEARDVVVVQANPLHRSGLPQTPAEIEKRKHEISFNSSLLWETRFIQARNELVRQGFTHQGRLHEVFLHAINADQTFEGLNLSSVMNTQWDFLSWLYEAGQQAARRWLEESLDSLGHRSTFDPGMLTSVD